MDLLIKKAMKGNTKAFIELIDLNEQTMYQTAKAILAQEEDIGDAMQETILAAYKNISSLKEVKYFKTWLIRILINKCRDIIKTNQKVVLIKEYHEEKQSGDENLRIEIEECIEELSKGQQIVINLYYREGFNTREISEMLDENENTIKSRLTRARETFKKIYIKSEKGVYNK